MDETHTGLHELSFEGQELAAVVEALHTWLVKRVGWCLWNRAWRDLDWETNQMILHAATQAYTKAYLAMREHEADSDFIKEGFTEVYQLTPRVWDYLARITSATSWDEMERHHQCRCDRCLNPDKKMKHGNGCQCRLCNDVHLLEQPWLL